MGSITPLPPGATYQPDKPMGWLGRSLIAGVIVGLSVLFILSVRSSQQGHYVDATIVTTYTTPGGLLSSGQAVTVYDTPEGRKLRAGIWGIQGDRLRIWVYEND
jgi:hypothetical protein